MKFHVTDAPHPKKIATKKKKKNKRTF